MGFKKFYIEMTSIKDSFQPDLSTSASSKKEKNKNKNIEKDTDK